jgi:spore coat protein U-like protein
MTTPRSLLIALVALAVLIGTRPIASVEQYPHGLMSAAPKTPGGNQSCTIETRPISFGNYDPLRDADVHAIGQVIYTCSGGGGGGGGNPGGPGNGNPGGPGTTGGPASNSIRIEMAQGSSNSFAPRHMYGLSFEFLEYNIYLDSNHHQVWGTGEGPTLAYVDSNPPNNRTITVPAFARIFGGQDVTWGPYTDNVPVRILF